MTIFSSARARGLAWESVKYFLVSAISLVLDLALFWLLMRQFAEAMPTMPLITRSLIANSLSNSAGLVLNYALSVTMVFKERRLKSRRAEFVGFVLIGLAGLVVNDGFVILFVGVLALGTVIGKVAAAGLSFVFNFCVRRLLLFSAPRERSPQEGGAHG